MGQFGNLGGLGMGLDGQTSGIPRGHGRRHSVNVLNKAAGQNIGSLDDGNFEPFDDGFNPPGQQQRGTCDEIYTHGRDTNPLFLQPPL